MKDLSEDVKKHLASYTDFLLKAGYCDVDVYSESPTAIDQYLEMERKRLTDKNIIN